MHIFLKFSLCAGILAAFFGGSFSLRGASVVSYHNDSVSSGVNPFETILTPANVNVGTFAKRFSTAVDGQIYAQPLYVPGVAVTDGSQAGTHNLAIVRDPARQPLCHRYATTGVVVWQTSFLASGLPGATAITSVPSSDTGSTDTSPEIGICSTPVIDPTTDLLYVTAKTKQIISGATSTPNYVYTLYQIDITNGNATANANIVSSTIIGDTVFNGQTFGFRTNSDPTAAQDPFVFGTGESDSIKINGQNRVYFNVLRQMNRPGLILLNGIIYVCFASHGDINPYHGWVLGFDKNTLAVTAVCNLTPNGGLGGIWSSGGCPVVDASGNIYVMTGNGTFDGNNTGGTVTGLNAQQMPVNGDYGDCFVKLTTDSTTSPGNQNINGWGLKVADYFAPFNNQSLSNNDSDLGSGGCALLPDSAGSTAHPRLLVGAGKQGNIYLVDRDSMGKYSTTDNVVQSQVAIGECFDTPAFFNGVLYYIGDSDNGKAFAISNAVMSTTPVTTPDTFAWPGSTPSVSANDTDDGIAWTLDRGTGQLRAYSAAGFSTELWTSALAPNNRDQLGTVTKFATPTVADGRVMVGTTTALVVYGSLASPSLYFQNGASLGILSVNSSFLPNTWTGIGGVNSGWQEQDIGDINGDGVPDLIVQSGTLIGAVVMNANGTPNSWVGIGSMSSGWELRGAANITGDGNLDLIFQNGTLLGYLEVDNSGAPVSWTGIGAVAAGWQLRAVASLDGTGQPDLLFQNVSMIGALKVNASGAPTAWIGMGTIDTGWTLSYAVDLNGDGQPELIFQNGTLLGALQVNTSFQPVTWHGIGAMSSGWTLPGDY